MRQIVLIVGVENQEALETAAWYLKRGDTVYAGVTNGDAALKVRLEETYPGLHVNQLDLGTEEPAALAEQIMQAEKKLDVLVLQAGCRAEHDGEIGCEDGKYHDYDDMLRVLDYNINGMRQVIEQSIPLLRLGKEEDCGDYRKQLQCRMDERNRRVCVPHVTGGNTYDGEDIF